MRLVQRKFSIRTLLVIVTLVALWLAALPLCSEGKIDVIKDSVARNGRMMEETNLVAPFLFHCWEFRVDKIGKRTNSLGRPVAIPGFDLKMDLNRTVEHTFCVWWFGRVWQLPFTLDGSSESRDLRTKHWLPD